MSDKFISDEQKSVQKTEQKQIQKDSLLGNEMKSVPVPLEQEDTKESLKNLTSEKLGMIEELKEVSDLDKSFIDESVYSEDKKEYYGNNLRKDITAYIPSTYATRITRKLTNKDGISAKDKKTYELDLKAFMLRPKFRVDGDFFNKAEKYDDEDASFSYKKVVADAKKAKAAAERYPSGTDEETYMDFFYTDKFSAMFDAVMNLYESSREYYDSHRGFRFTSTGKARKAVAVEYKEWAKELLHQLSEARQFVQKVPTDIEDEDYGEIDEELKIGAEDITTSHKISDEFIAYYKKWNETLAKNVFETPETMCRKRLTVFGPYIDHLKRFCAGGGKEVTQAHKDALAEYQSLVDMRETIDWARKTSAAKKSNLDKGVIQENVFDNEIKKELFNKDEREESESLPSEFIDKMLTKDQLRGVEEIDRWLIRNYNNGGLVGLFWSGINNRTDEYVLNLLQKTKRERLFVYYLIETRQRVNPNIGDVEKSTEYVPTLSGFKSRMLAHKLKLDARATGGYVYTHKLAEASLIAEQYSPMIKSNALAKLDKNTLGEITEKQTKDLPEEVKQMLQKRTEVLKDFGDSIKKYWEVLADLKEKGIDGEEARNISDQYLNRNFELSATLTQLDDDLKVYDKNNMQEVDKHVSTGYQHMAKSDYTKFAGGLGFTAVKSGTSFLPKIADMSSKVHLSWGLKQSDFAPFSMWSGSVANGLAMCGGAFDAVMQMYKLSQVGGQMSGMEVVNTVGSMLVSLGKIVTAGLKIKDVVSAAAETVVTAESTLSGVSNELSKAKALSGPAEIATAGVSMAVNAIRIIDNVNRKSYIKSAKEALEKKRYDQGDAKAEREKRYDKGMIDLAERLNKRNTTTAGIDLAGSAVSMIGILVPGVGTVATVVGFTLTAASSITKAVMQSLDNGAMFDHYVDMDNLMEKVKTGLKKNDRPIPSDKELRAALRLKCAGALGYPTVSNACRRISRKYAEYIHSKLFEEELSEEEKQPYIDLVENFGASYESIRDGAESDKPSIEYLAKKMSGN